MIRGFMGLVVFGTIAIALIGVTYYYVKLFIKVCKT
jgi:hypothetical protein